MTRSTIDFGIDLGTTNSSIAILKGTGTEVFRNNDQLDYTPSAVWIDRNGGVVVGKTAKARLEDDAENVHCEFKLQMGSSAEYDFKRAGRKMGPEDLSAEVLKTLKGDVRQSIGEDVDQAVITVPAAFELPQCEATKRAAQAAGLAFCPLLLEPVAAALAYGFQSESDKVFWLAYDLGGGTFDSALIHLRDGSFQVANHGGDNHLGGKLIDWAIVDELLIPALTKNFPLKDFRRGGDPKWRRVIAKLKAAAEEAKIRVSRSESANISVDNFQDDTGRMVEFDYTLKRADVERLAEPFIVRSINICKKVLEERRLRPEHVQKVLLVGGPTLAYYLRERLADPKDGLGIPLEFSVDPLTVVARGAAIFAGTQVRDRTGSSGPQIAGQFQLQLQYDPIGADCEPPIGGKVAAPEGQTLEGFTIEFVNSEAVGWRSGKIPLTATGTFMTSLWAERGRRNTYRIDLCDATGTRRDTDLAAVTYTIGVAPEAPILVHDIGIWLADNSTGPVFSKGASLPARKRAILKTFVEARRGQAGHALRIPVVEGDSSRRADRNRLIGDLQIPAENLPRDVPAGSDVEVTIEIDVHRNVRTKAYIPLVDEEYEQVLTLEKKKPEPAELRSDLTAEKDRLRAARDKAKKTGDLQAHRLLHDIDQEQMEQNVESALAASTGDRDAADKCQNRLLDLKAKVDDVEKALEWPTLLAQAELEIQDMQTVVQKHGKTVDKQKALQLEEEARQIIAQREPDLLRHKTAEIATHRFRVLQDCDAWWVALFRDLEGRRASLRDPSLADQLFAQGNRAINSNDVPSLKSAVRQLLALLPIEQQKQVEGRRSEVI